jgi:hypothetical protein
MKPRLP